MGGVYVQILGIHLKSLPHLFPPPPSARPQLQPAALNCCHAVLGWTFLSAGCTTARAAVGSTWWDRHDGAEVVQLGSPGVSPLPALFYQHGGKWRDSIKKCASAESGVGENPLKMALFLLFSTLLPEKTAAYWMTDL